MVSKLSILLLRSGGLVHWLDDLVGWIVIEAIELSDDVELRLLTVHHAAELAAAFRRNREHLAPWEPVRPEEFYTEEGQAERIAGLVAGYTAGTTVPFVIERAGQIIGVLNLSDIVGGAFLNGHLGYWLDYESQGAGLMTKAVHAVVELAFGQLGLHRLQAATLLHNAASQQVLANCGFVRIGIAEQYLRIAGRWQDHILFQRVAPAA